MNEGSQSVIIFIQSLALLASHAIAHLFLLALSLILSGQTFFPTTFPAILSFICPAALLAAFLAVVRVSLDGYGNQPDD